MNEPYDAEMNMMRTEKVFIFYVKEAIQENTKTNECTFYI